MCVECVTVGVLALRFVRPVWSRVRDYGMAALVFVWLLFGGGKNMPS